MSDESTSAEPANAESNHEGAARLLAGMEQEELLSATSRQMIERFMKTWKLSAFHALLMTELLSETELANALARILALPRLHQVSTLPLAEGAVGFLSFRRARAWECLPVKGDGGGIQLVFADPSQESRTQAMVRGLNKRLNCEITLAVAERSDIVKAIDELYPLSAQLPSLYRATGAAGTRGSR